MDESKVIYDAVREYMMARENNSSFHSLHEALGVLHEEQWELNMAIYQDLLHEQVYLEIIQNIAMLLAMAEECILNDNNIRKRWTK